MTEKQEIRIIVKVLNGDIDAYEILVREYEKIIYNLAFRIVKSRDTAADLSRKVFLKAFHSLPSFSLDSPFSVWLYTIASGVYSEYLKSSFGHFAK
ncbi:MAG: RNA polymerase sigma factor [Candidatus Limivicinus sp.]|jgi:DNA-directed RNA polymerase specialized sigma24 family protein